MLTKSIEERLKSAQRRRENNLRSI